MKNVSYKTDSKAFTNALQFWNHIKSHNESFHFELYDDVFGSIDWKTEPEEGMDLLCAKRATMIREKYDWVRIWYSAGRDSHHILTTFLENNLKVDELLIMDWSIMKRFESDAKIAYDTAKNLFITKKSKAPLITVFKTDRHEYDRYFHKDFFLKSSGYGSNYNFNMNQYPHILSTFRELNIKKGSIADIFGFEKSKIHIDIDGKFYFQMNDKNFNQGMAESNNVEWFYLSEDVPEIAVKQSHMIMNHLKKLNVSNSSEIDKFQESKVSYDDFASILSRGSKVSEQTGTGTNKIFGFNHSQYSEVFNAAKEGNWSALKHYNEFIDHVSFLNDSGSYKFWQAENQSFAGVPTLKYYLE
jgi:hypothetical protein